MKESKLIKNVSLHTGIKEMYKFLDRTLKAVMPGLVSKLKIPNSQIKIISKY